MAFATQPGANGYDNAYFGTEFTDVLVAFNQSGTTYVGGRQEADSITFFQPDTGVLSSTTVQAGQGADTIAVNTSLTESLLNGNKDNDFLSIIDEDAVAQSLIYGGDGDDLIEVDIDALVNSTLNGNVGNDIIDYEGGLASSRIFGGDNNDTIFVTTGLGDVITDSKVNGNLGNDYIDGDLIAATVSSSTFYGGQGADTLFFQGAINQAGPTAGFVLSGDLGNDQITGAEFGDDLLLGGDGNDTIFASGFEDTVIGAAGADVYSGDTFAEGSTFVIEAISDSAAAVSGTARTFDQFEGPDSFYTGFDELDISAVASGLAGGPVTPFTSVDFTDISGSLFGFYNDFAELQADINVFGGFTASDVNQIEGYYFTADIAGNVANYLWINDSQELYSSSDLLFQTNSLFQIGENDVVVA